MEACSNWVARAIQNPSRHIGPQSLLYGPRCVRFRTATTLGQYSPVRPSHSVSKRLLFRLFHYANGLLFEKKTVDPRNSPRRTKAFRITEETNVCPLQFRGENNTTSELRLKSLQRGMQLWSKEVLDYRKKNRRSGLGVDESSTGEHLAKNDDGRRREAKGGDIFTIIVLPWLIQIRCSN